MRRLRPPQFASQTGSFTEASCSKGIGFPRCRFLYMPPGDESQFACMFRVPPEEAKRKLKSLQSRLQKIGQFLRDKKLANFGAGKLAAPSCPAATPLTKPHDPLYDNRFDGWNPNSHQRRWAYSWRKLRTKAGLPDVEFYHLGHTSITAGGSRTCRWP